MNISKIKKVASQDEYKAALLQLGRMYLYDFATIKENETTDDWKQEEAALNSITKGKLERDAYREELVEMVTEYEEKHPVLDWAYADSVDYLQKRLEQMMVPLKQLKVLGASAGNLNLILNRKADFSKQQIRNLYKYFAIPSDILIKEPKLNKPEKEKK